METLKDEFVSGVDGLAIRVHGWRPTGAPLASVVIAHGIGEHGRRYAEFGGVLARAGYEVWALDHRGHGESLTSQGLGFPGTFEGTEQAWNALVADLGQWLASLRANHPERPLVLFGHSMGSLIAQTYCTRGAASVDALILSGTTLVEPRPCPDPGTSETPIGGFHPGNLHELADLNAPFQPERTPYDWLSRDTEQVDAYVDDPLCGFDSAASAGLFGPRELLALSDPDLLKQLPHEMPVLLVAGDADPLNRRLGALRRLEVLWRAAGVRRIDSHFYVGARHEVLNELNRSEVMDDILAWIASVL